jgi:hypothetical protein
MHLKFATALDEISGMLELNSDDGLSGHWFVAR